VRAGAAAAAVELLGHDDARIGGPEKQLLAAAGPGRARELAARRSIPGVGAIPSLTIRYEADGIARFATRQQFAAYGRRVAPRQESAGKRYGAAGRKQGNAYRKGAFSEAAVSAARHSPRIGAYRERLAARHGAGTAKSVLAHQPGRAVYHLLRDGAVSDAGRFLRG